MISTKPSDAIAESQCVLKNSEMDLSLFLKEDQLSFYRGYGTQTAELWNEFKVFLDTHKLNPKELAAALASAKQTFEDMGVLMVSASN